jgi:hypothetical protein
VTEALPQLFSFGLLVWAGLYLAARDLRSPALLPAAAALLLAAALPATGYLDRSPSPLIPGLALAAWVLAALVAFRRSDPTRRGPAVLMGVTATALLAAHLLALPQPAGPLTPALLPAAGLLGAVVAARLHARAGGARLLPHLARSFDFSFFTGLVFAGPVAIVVASDPAPADLLHALPLVTLASAIAFQVFWQPFSATVESIAYSAFPRLRDQSDRLRTELDLLPASPPHFSARETDPAEFTRLTRRALSAYGDLPKLAASPLIQLPEIDRRRAGGEAGSLARAAELKKLLAAAIDRLKPDSPASFGESDEWRHYNSLYFPYVAGLRPYSRRAAAPADPVLQEAAAWFAAAVPERTLHNWQNEAAALIAQHLRELEDLPA